jgi:PhnB protein
MVLRRRAAGDPSGNHLAPGSYCESILGEYAMKNENVKPIPEGYHTMTPALTVQDGARMIEFYQKAFGAQERYRMPTPDGKHVAHAELQIGDSAFMLGEEMPGSDCGGTPNSLGGVSVGFYLYVEDVQAAFDQAVAAGATVKQPPEDMFWGDRIGTVTDPSGHSWTLASHVEDVPPDEIARRGKEAFEKMYQGAGQP